MKWMFTCKEVTEICCDEDRKLGPMETIMFWMHLGMCKVCFAYKKQIEFIRQSMKKIMSNNSQVEVEKVQNLSDEIINKYSKNS
jgi:hypothetical protein